MRENIVTNQLIRAHLQAVCNASGVRNSAGHPCADRITGLPNRAILEWYLELRFAFSRESQPNSAVLVIALEDVDAMRDVFGDGVYNKFMQIVAQRFRKVAKSGQFVSALGTNEFAFAISESAGRDDCIAVANSLLVRLGEEIKIDGQMCFSSAKVGIAFADIKLEAPADLLHRARAVLQEERPNYSDSIRFADRTSAKHVPAAQFMPGELCRAEACCA